MQITESFLQSESIRDLRDGVPVRGIRRHPHYARMLSEADEILQHVYSGSKRGQLMFEEAMSTSDFPLIFGDILDRKLLGWYQELPASWRMYCREGEVPDFRLVNRFAVDGAAAALSDVIAPGAPYPEAAVSEARYQYKVEKRGRTVALDWETMVNDDLDSFRRLPESLARAARRGEERMAASLFVGAAGPNTATGAMFHSSNNNVLSGNPALSVAALADAIELMAQQTDADGELFAPGSAGYVLVIPPALEVIASQIMNATEVRLNDNGGTTNQQIISRNWLADRFEVAVNPYLQSIPTSNKLTSWYVFAKDAGRPALELGLLRGHKRPELFRKASNAQAIGGAIDPMAGDYETDALGFKVRHVFGGTAIDPKMAVASNGSGS